MDKFKQFSARLKELQKKRTLKIGFFEGQKYEDGTSIADVAFWNEFGTRAIPPRPFMRITVAKHGDEWKKYVANAVQAHLEGKADIDDMLESIGDVAVANVKETIESNIPPPNKPSTRKRKEGTKEVVVTKDESKGLNQDVEVRGTLIDTGEMLRSVDRVVEK